MPTAPIRDPIASALALAWARSLPPMRGDAWRTIDPPSLGIAAWQHVPALVTYVDELEAENALLRRASCGRCSDDDVPPTLRSEVA
jgi:hypothetical protein